MEAAAGRRIEWARHVALQDDARAPQGLAKALGLDVPLHLQQRADEPAATIAVDDLEEQARRASIPPGWLR